MDDQSLGRLEKVDLRSAWETEAGDFTPWLAREDNLALLGEAIGIELELEATEKDVGPFRADILCKDTDTSSWVLIENQLGRTDHTHLGQLLTYAAGLQAVTIVWIAYPFVDEHRAALDWLNDITDDRFRFFGLEVELWRIGQSPAAPKFNVVSKPNNWTRSISRAAGGISEEALSDTKKLQLAYWEQFRKLLEREGSPIRPQKPYPQHWMNFGVGRSEFLLAATLNSSVNRIGVELTIGAKESKEYFNLLKKDREAIENAIGSPLEWMELPDRKSCRIVLFRENANPLREEAWPEYQSWMKEKLETLSSVFRPRVKALNAEDWKPPG